jgi:membrane fusion protein, type I secretion system
MKQNNGPQPYDDDEPSWIREQRHTSVGPQGAALILELQRLRTAFEQSDSDNVARQERRPAHGDGRSTVRQRTSPAKRRKSKIGRVIDVCLAQLGLHAAAPAKPRSKPFAPRAASAPRRRSPTLAPDDRAPFDIANLTPERFDRDHAHSPTPAPPRRRSPTLAPDDRASFDIASLTPERLDRDRAHSPAPAPPRRRSPALAPDGPTPIDMPGPAPERLDRDDPLPRPAPLDAPRLLLSPRVDMALPASAAANENITKRPIETFRARITAGVAFLVNRDGSAYLDAPGDSLSVGVGRAFERELRTGLRVLIAAVVVIGGWGALVPLAGAVVVPGNLVVQSNVKTVQHPSGGIVAEIAVRNGMRVEPGQLLVRLDATQARSSLQVVTKQLDDDRVRIARLVAERDGLSRPEIPVDMANRAAEPAVMTLLASELSLFNARTNARKSQKDLLQSRVAQLGEEISGLDAQIKSKADQLDLIAGELTGVQDLYDKRLVPLTRLTTLQRESARIDGERGQLQSSIAETKAKIGEAQLQIVRIDQDFRTEVVKELSEVQGKEAELVEHGVAARDTLDRIEIRAPTSGIVNQLAIHTVGGVIRPGDTIMEIVPDSDDLQIEARVQPVDIDHVRLGQKAFVRFSAFNQRVTPQLVGEVSYVSADTSKEQQTNAPSFTVRVMLPEEERRRLAGLQLVSGMPAELFLQTGSRTMMSYLLKPITEQLGRAFVEN